MKAFLALMKLLSLSRFYAPMFHPQWTILLFNGNLKSKPIFGETPLWQSVVSILCATVIKISGLRFYLADEIIQQRRSWRGHVRLFCPLPQALWFRQLQVWHWNQRLHDIVKTAAYRNYPQLAQEDETLSNCINFTVSSENRSDPRAEMTSYARSKKHALSINPVTRLQSKVLCQLAIPL